MTLARTSVASRLTGRFLRILLLGLCCVLPPGLVAGASSVQVSAQTASASKAEVEVRRLITAGDLDTARALLAGLGDSIDVKRLRVEIAIAAADPIRAAEAYAQFVVANGDAEDLSLLRRVAEASLAGLAREPDPLLHTEACAVLARRGDAGCRGTLAKLSRSVDAPITLRLVAAAALSGSPPTGPNQAPTLPELAAGAGPNEQRAIASVASRFPAAQAVPVLKQLLGSDAQDVQYSAAQQLGDLQTAESREILRAFVAANPAARATGAARLALARLGDPGALKTIGGAIAQLRGGDQLSAAEALLAAGDSRAVDALLSLAAGDHEQVRVAAAALLGDRRPDVTRKVIEVSMSSANPWVRADAIDAFRHSRYLTLPVRWRALRDDSPWVRLRAADATLVLIDPPVAR